MIDHRYAIYKELSLDQRISLKGEFETNPECENYWLVLKLWGFVIAVDYFLTDDVSFLRLASPLIK